LLSHFHLDHIIGFFWIAAALQGKEIDVYGQPGTEKAITTLIDRPFFPTPIMQQHLKLRINEIDPGRTRIADLVVECDYLKHSDPVYGYRINNISYCTDTMPCRNSVKLSRDADLLIHESAFSEAKARGSHSKPSEAAQIASEANAKKLVLFHFDANTYRLREDKVEAGISARRIFPNTVVAEDLMEITV
jgi:ribonuclease BN (tRNA processing enzyme)